MYFVQSLLLPLFDTSHTFFLRILKPENKISVHLIEFKTVPAGNDMFKVNNRNTRAMCEICSKLTIKIPERLNWRRSGIFIVNFEHISHLVLVFLLLTLNI